LHPAAQQEQQLQQQQQPTVWSDASTVSAVPRGSNNGDFAPLCAASPSGDWRIAVAAHEATHADVAAVPEEEEQVLEEEAHQQQPLPGKELQGDSVCSPSIERKAPDSGSSSSSNRCTSEWGAAGIEQQLPVLAGDEQLLDVGSVGSTGRTNSWKATLSDVLYGRFSSSDGSSSRNSTSGQRRSTSDAITAAGKSLQLQPVLQEGEEQQLTSTVGSSSSSKMAARYTEPDVQQLAGEQQLLDGGSVASTGRTSSWKATLSDLLYGRFSSSDGSSSSRNSTRGQRRSTSDAITAAGKSLQLQPALQEVEEQQLTSTVDSSSSKMAARCTEPDLQELAGEQQLSYVGSVASTGRTSSWKATLSDLLYGRFSSSDGSSSTSGQCRSTSDAITAAGKSLQLQPILQEGEEQLLASTVGSSSSSSSSSSGGSTLNSAQAAALMQPVAAGKVLGSMPMQVPNAAVYCADAGCAAAAAFAGDRRVAAGAEQPAAAGVVAMQQLKAAVTPANGAAAAAMKKQRGVQSGAHKGASSTSATHQPASKTAARRDRSSSKHSASSCAADGGVVNSWHSWGSRISKVLLLVLLPCVLLLALYSFQGTNR
jgi:hypothetical protein